MSTIITELLPLPRSERVKKHYYSVQPPSFNLTSITHGSCVENKNKSTTSKKNKVYKITKKIKIRSVYKVHTQKQSKNGTNKEQKCLSQGNAYPTRENMSTSKSNESSWQNKLKQ